MKRKAKILFTIPNFDTAGSGKAMLKIITRLDPEVFEPHIACLHDRGAFFNIVKASGVPVHIYPYFHSMSSRFNGILQCWKKRKFYASFDLVHSFHYADDYSEALAARLGGCRWIYVKKNMNWGTGAWNLRTKLAHGVIAQNTDMLKLFFAHKNPKVLIPRGVDTNEFSPQPPAAALLDEFGLSEGHQVILTVANLVPVKGIEFLIEGFSIIKDMFPKAVLMIVGDDSSDYAAGLKSLAATMNDRIIFTGKRPDIKDFQSIATVFVLPTLNKGRQEGSPVSLLEAMAGGTCVIASDVAGIRDQLQHIPEQLFQPGNARQIAEKLSLMLSMPASDRQALIVKQLEIIQHDYTIEKEVARHEAFYSQILGMKAGQ